MNLLTKQKQTLTDLDKELCQSGDSQGVWDGHVYTTLFKMANQQGLYMPMLYDSLDEKGVQGKMDICMDMHMDICVDLCNGYV